MAKGCKNSKKSRFLLFFLAHTQIEAMVSLSWYRSLRAKEWRSLWLLVPPLYGVWLLTQAGELFRYRFLYRTAAWVGVLTSSAGLTGFVGLGILGILDTDRLLAFLISYPGLPLWSLGSVVFGTILSAAVCGVLLLQVTKTQGAPGRWWLACVWPLGLQARLR